MFIIILTIYGSIGVVLGLGFLLFGIEPVAPGAHHALSFRPLPRGLTSSSICSDVMSCRARYVAR